MKLSTLGFLAIIGGLPLGQVAFELAHGERPQVLEIVGPLEEQRLRAFEDDLHAASIVTREAVPRLQHALTRWLRRGNEKVLFGPDDWMFLAEDVDFVTGPGILEPGVGGRAAIDTIRAFDAALAERDVELLVVPVPTKAVVEGHRLAPGVSGRPDNADAERFFAELAAAGVDVLDLRALFEELRASEPELYLRHDTHWRPETMCAVAERIAARVRSLSGGDDASGRQDERGRYRAMSRTVDGAGDTLAMLSLPSDHRIVEPVRIDAIVDARTGEPWSSDRTADVLLLGDSFTRVFSDERLGHGSGAGLAEQLAFALDRTIDVIAMAGGGALQPREALAQRPEGVRGKRVVVWEFTERELAAGPARWKPVELPPSPPAGAPEAPEPEPEPEPERVPAEIVAISELGPDFDYGFCLGIFTYELLAPTSLGEAGDTISVAFPLVVDWERTEAAGFGPGDRHHLELDPIDDHYDLEATCWVDDTDGPLSIWLATRWERLE